MEIPCSSKCSKDETLESVNSERRQPRGSPAEVYEELFVPALFQQWASVVADAAEVGLGQERARCRLWHWRSCLRRSGTSRAERSRCGMDPNEEMLAVARRKDETIEWLMGHAEAIPFPDESFDTVVSQFGLMFFENKATSLREMMRVLRPGGHLAVAVCDCLEHSPGYCRFAELLRTLFDDRVRDAFHAPFVLGDAQALLSLCVEAGIFGAKVTQHHGTVRFASIRALVSTERACVWTLGGLLDDARFEQLAKESEKVLRPFAAADGTLAFAMPSLIVTAAKACVTLPETLTGDCRVLLVFSCRQIKMGTPLMKSRISRERLLRISSIFADL